jgi:hypothetical protein
MTPAAQQTKDAVLERFDFINGVGGYKRRFIGGTTTWSQHSWANADDIYLDTIAQGDEVAAFLEEYREELGIRVLLWRHPHHWDASPPYRHIHADFWPKGVQTPPLTRIGKGYFKYSNGSIIKAPIRKVPAEGEGVDELNFLSEEAQQFWQAQYEKQKAELDPPTNEDAFHTLVTHVRDHPGGSTGRHSHQATTVSSTTIEESQ